MLMYLAVILPVRFLPFIIIQHLHAIIWGIEIYHAKKKCRVVMHMSAMPLNNVLSFSHAINASSSERENRRSELSVNISSLGNGSPLQVESWAKVELE